MSKSNGFSGLKFGVSDGIGNSVLLPGTTIVGPLVQSPLNETFFGSRTGTAFNALNYDRPGLQTNGLGFAWLVPRGGKAFGRVRTGFSWAINTASPGTALPVIDVNRITFLPSAEAEDREVVTSLVTTYLGSIQTLAAGQKIDIQTDPAVLGLLAPIEPPKPFPLEFNGGDLILVSVRLRIVDDGGGGVLDAVLNHAEPQEQSNHFNVSFGPPADTSGTGLAFP